MDAVENATADGPGLLSIEVKILCYGNTIHYAPALLTGDLRLEIPPLRRNAPVHFEPKDRLDFGNRRSLVELPSAAIVNRYRVELGPATP